ncbi:MAG TPA: DUF4233 domain-containing protein [Pseudonocardia sp.]
MSSAEPTPGGPAVPAVPDPTKGLRGVYAALLVLEAIVVGLALLVLPKFGVGATPLGVALIGGVAVAMVVASGLQRRPWGLAVALALQAATLACGLLVPALALVGLIFGAVWAGILLMARDVRRRYARGELPAQVAAREAARERPPE